MSKYAEAIRMRKSGLLITNGEWRMLADTIDKALEIADRLEQADIKKVIANNNKLDFKGRKIVSKEEMGYRDGFLDGYNQALADIRGDEK